MVDDSRLDRFEKTLDAIHCTVVKIENEHGAKIDALFEGQESLRTDVAGLKADVAGLKTGQEGLRTDIAGLRVGQREIRGEVREVKSSVGLLHAIANQHESRLQKVEGSLADHLANDS